MDEPPDHGAVAPPTGLPQAVEIGLDDTIAEYWRRRAHQHHGDSYAGVPMNKFPEDLRVYEHLLWASGANVVVEIGVQSGGSTLWFRDRLRTNAGYRPMPGRPRVIGIDIDLAGARGYLAAADPGYEADITLIEADITDPAVARQVSGMIDEADRCLVVEDSAHIYATTMASLTGFWHLVPPGGFFVVEDGCVDVEEMRIYSNWPRGVLPAVDDWLRTDDGRRFARRRELELYGLTCHPAGYLQRVS